MVASLDFHSGISLGCTAPARRSFPSAFPAFGQTEVPRGLRAANWEQRRSADEPSRQPRKGTMESRSNRIFPRRVGIGKQANHSTQKAKTDLNSGSRYYFLTPFEWETISKKSFQKPKPPRLFFPRISGQGTVQMEGCRLGATRLSPNQADIIARCSNWKMKLK